MAAVAGVLATQGGCALLGGREPVETPAQVEVRVAREAEIRLAVEARLAAEPAIGAGRIRAVVDDGEVELHGVALGFGALQCAIANAELVPGVRLVIDMMVLQPGPSRVTCLAPRVAPLAPAIPVDVVDDVDPAEAVDEVDSMDSMNSTDSMDSMDAVTLVDAVDAVDAVVPVAP